MMAGKYTHYTLHLSNHGEHVGAAHLLCMCAQVMELCKGAITHRLVASSRVGSSSISLVGCSSTAPSSCSKPLAARERWPSCPCRPSPQVNREPSDTSASECCCPAAHDTTRVRLQ
jgi:hypothetical protein